MYTTVVLFYLILNSNPGFGNEPVCSRFHYEERTLEKMIRQEIVVEKMKVEMEEIKQEVFEALAELKNERRKIAEDFEKKSQDIETIEDDMDKAVAKIKIRNDENIEAYLMEMENIKNVSSTPYVAFRAYKTPVNSVTNNKVIVFSENLINKGYAYNNQTGIFVAPIGGIYLFTTQICVQSSTWFYFGIFVEEKLISGREAGDKYRCSSLDAVTMVDKGEQVSIKLTYNCDSSDKLWNNSDYVMSSFSGVLLHMISK